MAQTQLLAVTFTAWLAAASHAGPLDSRGLVAWGDDSQRQCTPTPYLGTFTQLDGGASFSIGLKDDGSIGTWGIIRGGQLADGIRTFAYPAVQVAAGTSHVAVLLSNGSVVCWGAGEDASDANSSGGQDYGQSMVPADLLLVSQVSCGENHTAALQIDGTVRCWGAGWANTGAAPHWGQSLVPPRLEGVSQVDCGALHTVATLLNGSVVAWGQNTSQQASVPADLAPATAVAGGGSHTVALLSNGTVRCWGLNSSGQCTVPAGLANVVQIAAGTLHSVALSADGTVRCWGSGTAPSQTDTNNNGQSNVPANLPPIASIAAGTGHTLALDADGRFIGWGFGVAPPWQTVSGDDKAGQAFSPLNPAQIAQISACDMRTIIRDFEGRVSQVGVANYYAEGAAPAGLRAVQVAAGPHHSMARLADGTIKFWGTGFNSNGSPSYGQSIVPANTTPVRDVAAGYYHSMAVHDIATNPGLAVCWGAGTTVGSGTDNDHWGQSIVPPMIGSLTKMAGGEYHTVALRADGKVFCWGAGTTVGPSFWDRGQCIVPVDLAPVTSVAAGRFHTLAVDVTRHVRCWGDNSAGACTPPAGLDNVRQVAGGYVHSVALRMDGSVVAWGTSDYGQCAVPPSLPHALQVAAGLRHTIVLVGERCDGDVDLNGIVDGQDLGLLLGAWGVPAHGLQEDLDLDGDVDGEDLGLLLGSWGECP